MPPGSATVPPGSARGAADVAVSSATTMHLYFDERARIASPAAVPAYRLAVLCTVAVLLWGPHARGATVAVTPAAGAYVQGVWTSVEGLPPNAADALLQTREDDAVAAPKVRPFFYRAGWFLLLALAIAVLAAGLYLMRLRAARRRDRKPERSVSARTGELVAQKEVPERAAHVKTQLLGIVAHDLKNPLSGVRGLAEAIEEEIDPTSPAAGMARDIRDAAQHMLALVDDLLNSAALEMGRLVLHKQSVDAAALVEEVAAANRAAAQRKMQTLHVDVDDACTLSADGRWLRILLDNLVSNAVKYSPRGERIDVRVRVRDGVLRLEVEDRGPGLTAADRDRLFGQFQRLSAQPTGGESSSGLGLFIVHEIVRLHEGRVWAEGEVDRGTTFVVELPC